MNLRKYIRRNIYRWHRITSLIIALPVILWALSGCLHPIMSALKPNVSTDALTPEKLEVSRIKIALQDVLAAQGIKAISRFRIVTLNNHCYYQVACADVDTLSYFSCENGSPLVGGDQQWAAEIARRYLKTPARPGPHSHKHHGQSAASRVSFTSTPAVQRPAIAIPSIRRVELVTAFNSAYKKSNVFLPVYRVTFNRSDSLTLYVDPSSDRLAYVADTRQLWFSRFFSLTHSWSFLDSIGIWTSFLPGTFSAICFLSSLFGFYVYNMMNQKKQRSTRRIHAHRAWHRITGNLFLVTTLLFSISGAWHSYAKISGDRHDEKAVSKNTMLADELNFLPGRVKALLKDREILCGVSGVQMQGKNYLQLTVKDGEKVKRRFIDLHTYSTVPDGELTLGRWLASEYAGKEEVEVVSVRTIEKFNEDYNMMFRRLPVVEVALTGNEKYYFEIPTGALSAVTTDASRAERFSFSNLHMHHFWKSWLGKDIGQPVRNAVLIISAAGLFLLAVTGMWMYIKKVLHTVTRSR